MRQRVPEAISGPAAEPAQATQVVVRTSVQVSGQLVPPMAVTFYLEAPDGTFASRPGRSGDNGSFAIEAGAPLTAVGVHTVEADGTERRLQFTREAAKGRDDWSLGCVTFPVTLVEVRCELALDPDVAARMVRCGQEIVTA